VLSVERLQGANRVGDAGTCALENAFELVNTSEALVRLGGIEI